MAKATKSKKNSKLPVPTKIAFCTAAGKNMATKLFTGENGKFSRKVGFKQTSKAYPFQIQYRQRSRYTLANEKKKGARWTKWSGWKNAVAVSDIPVDTTNTAKPINTWMKANKGVNKNSDYVTFKTFSGYQIPATYDARQFQYRIRSFNKSKARHGNFATKTLTVYKRAAIVDEEFVAQEDGGLRVKFNYIWDRSVSVHVNSIKDSSGRELLRKKTKKKIAACKLGTNTIPVARSGYSPGMVKIPLSELKRAVDVGETLKANIVAVTGDGAETAFQLDKVYEPTWSGSYTHEYTWDELRGLLTVKVSNSEANVDSIGINASYTYNGKRYAIPAVKKSVKLVGTSTFYFYPPIGLDFKYTINCKIDDNSCKKSSGTLNFKAPGYRLNSVEDLSVCGIGWGNPTFEVTTEPSYETSLPFGRESNVIFYGVGNTTNINFQAKVVDKPNVYGGDYQIKKAWDKVRNNPGVYYFRSSKGDMFKVGITSFDITKTEPDMYDITIQMVEVV